ncbi:MAG: PKD domain-containing protein [Candidatus Yanofskybacteria bacterium]|nr:PKD domain-containing protein [Candidatus Yanofskybacteria bacterium]
MINQKQQTILIFVGCLLSVVGLVSFTTVKANHGNVQVTGYPWACERAGTGYNVTISWHLNADPNSSFDYIPDISNDPNWSDGSWYNKLVSGTSSAVALDDSWGATWVTPPSWTKVLQVGTTYYTRVFANGSHSYGPNIYRPVCAATNPPTWSGQPDAVAAGSTYSVTVSWTGGQANPTFGYYIDISTDQANWTGTQTSNTSYTYSGLSPGVNYYFRTYTGSHSGTSGPLNVPVAVAPTCSSAGLDGVSVSYDATSHIVHAYNVNNATNVFFHVWTEANGTDDEQYYTAYDQGVGGEWAFPIPLSNHPGTGNVRVDAWMENANYNGALFGNAIYCDSANFIREPPPAPTCASATPDGSPAFWNTTQRFTATGITNATQVLFLTWDEYNGSWEDDLIAYEGVNAGGGTWYADVNLADHNGNINSTVISDVYMFNDNNSNVPCDRSSYNKLGGTRLAVSNPVTVAEAVPPTVSNVFITVPNYCISGPSATVGWDYSDPSGSPQSAYQVQMDNQSSFNSPEVDSGKISCENCRSFYGGLGALQFNTTYRARVRTWNLSDSPSAWREADSCSGTGCQPNGSWKTPSHAYPQGGNPPFSWTPLNPSINNPIQFTDNTVFDPASNNKQWSWTFVPAGGGSGSSSEQNPQYTFNETGTYQVTLKARDNAVPSGQFCAWPTAAINLQKPIPIWKEIAPR